MCDSRLQDFQSSIPETVSGICWTPTQMPPSLPSLAIPSGGTWMTWCPSVPARPSVLAHHCVPCPCHVPPAPLPEIRSCRPLRIVICGPSTQPDHWLLPRKKNCLNKKKSLKILKHCAVHSFFISNFLSSNYRAINQTNNQSINKKTITKLTPNNMQCIQE